MKSKKEVSTVSTATLKAELAKYLRLVEAGNEIVVLHHKTPIAKIIPINDSPLLESIKPKGEFSELYDMNIPEPNQDAKSDSLMLLLEERGSR